MAHLELTRPRVQQGSVDEAPSRPYVEQPTRERARGIGLPRLALAAIALLAIAGLAVVAPSALGFAAIVGALAYVVGLVWIFRTAEEPGGQCDRLDDLLEEQERTSRAATTASSATST